MDRFEEALRRSGERAGRRTGPESTEILDNLLQDMGRGVKARDFEHFLKAGMEALVELGIVIGLKNTPEYTVRAKSGIYNNVAIAVISAHTNDWEEARKFLNKAIYEVGLEEIKYGSY